ncbi:MAG: CvpA family protein [Asticcacaulis sp.]
MQIYDLIFLGMLALSCFAGVAQGGVKELINLFAFILALILGVLCKPMLARLFHLDTITGYIAALVVFFMVYAALRYIGHNLSDRMHRQKALSAIDRLLGLFVGIVRTLAFLGAFHLIFSLVTPIEHQPHWFRDAKVYPLSVKCAKVIQALIPASTGVANKVAEER